MSGHMESLYETSNTHRILHGSLESVSASLVQICFDSLTFRKSAGTRKVNATIFANLHHHEASGTASNPFIEGGLRPHIEIIGSRPGGHE